MSVAVSACCHAVFLEVTVLCGADRTNCWLHLRAASQVLRCYYFGIFNLDFLKHEVEPYLCFVVFVTEMVLMSK